MKTIRSFLCVAVSVVAWTASAARAQTAPEIYDATGVRGGLVVHLGCGDGKRTAALRAGEGYLVHGLDRDPIKVEAARQHVRNLKLYGPVSVDRLRGDHLPYVDNCVNLVIAEDLGRVPMGEVLRVLCPGGVPYVSQGGRWAKTVKPRPKEIDEWTHFLHGPDNNAVARDSVVGPPRRMQWMTGPLFQRAHHPQNSFSALVSTGGRIFYVMDEGAVPGPLEFPRRWSLLARDAFNGAFLWQRPIQSWAGYVEGWARGPDNLPRLLVAVGDRVYTALGLDMPIEALDASTGQTVRTYEGSGNAEEILVHEGVLLVVTGSPKPQQIAGARKMLWKPEVAKTILAFRADGGELLWKKSPPELPALRPLTLAAQGQRVFFADGAGVVCVDLRSGREVWRCGDRGDVKPGGKNQYYLPSGTLVAAEKAVVLAAPGGRAGITLRAADGALVWQFRAAPSDRRTVVRDRIESVWPVHGSVLVMDAAPAGKVSGSRAVACVAAGRSSYLDGGIWLYGLDPRTGEVVCSSRVQSEHPRGAKPPPDGVDLAELRTGDSDPGMKGSGVDWRTYLQPDQSDGHSMAGATTDILVSDGTSVYMRHLRFDRQLAPQKEGGRHFYSTKRLLDDTSGNGGHRAHWIVGTADHRRIPVAYSWMMESIQGRGRIGCVVPFGMLLAFDERTVWGFGSGKPADGLFAMENRPFSPDEKPQPDFAPLTAENILKPRWTGRIAGFTPQALVRAGKTIFLAGAVKAVARRDASPPKNAYTGLLGAYAADGGAKLAELPFDSPPAFGGMAAASGRLFLVTMDGKVLCFGGAK